MKIEFEAEKSQRIRYSDAIINIFTQNIFVRGAVTHN